MKTTLLILLFCISLQAQVGIGTETPLLGTYLDVAGKVRIQDITVTTSVIYLLTEDSQGIISKVALSDLQLNKCPNLNYQQSSGYYLKFESDSSIPLPNNPLIIEGKNFVSGGTWIQSNKYYFTYNNTSGQPVNIASFSVNFSGLLCNYKS